MAQLEAATPMPVVQKESNKLISARGGLIKLLFIVLSLVAALLLPIKRLIEVKGLPTHRDSATLHAGVTELYYLLVIPFIRV